MERTILQWAAKYPRPVEFINIAEKKVPFLLKLLNRKASYFFAVGVILFNSARFELAGAAFERALSYFVEKNDWKGISACYTNLGNVYHYLDFNKEIAYHKKALEIDRGLDDKEAMSKSCMGLGIAYEDLGDFHKAIECYEESLEIMEEIDDNLGAAKCYGNLGNTYHKLGDFHKAIECHNKSLEISMGLHDPREVSSCYTGLGNAYRNLGDFYKAIEYHEKCLEIAKLTNDVAELSNCYANLGNVYSDTNNYRKVLENYKKSLELAELSTNRALQSTCHLGLGNGYYGLGYFREAAEYSKKALDIAEEIGDKQRESSSYRGLGFAYKDLGYLDEAVECLEKALGIAKRVPDNVAISQCYMDLGIIYHDLGQFRKAIECSGKALTISQDVGDLFSQAINYMNMGRVSSNYLDESQTAYDYCKHSIELSEIIAETLVMEELKMGFYARVSDNAYQCMIPLCLKLGKEEEAFDFTERSKSRAFLDLLAATEIKPSAKPTGELELLLSDEGTYLARLREIQTRHLRQKRISLEPGEAEKIFEKLNSTYAKIQEIDPEYVFTRSGKPLSLDQIQNTLSLLKRNTVLVEYFVTEDKTYILVVSPKDKELHTKTVPISKEKLNRYIFEDYRREVVDHQGYGDIGDTWLSLSSYLIDPISEYLTESELIYFVPYGSLHYLPMHALELNGEPLIKQHAVCYSPSASLIKFCQNRGSGKFKSCASFGVVFEEEAKAVAELFNTSAYNGRSATKDNVIKNCTDKDIIHFSCHGYFDNLDPLSSGVELDDEVLTAREVFGIRLNAELVTLSACETGLNQRSPGDELIGLTRAFLYAGASSVIVSLWSVDARSTQELILEFYRLLKKGTDKATALQHAQKKIMEKEEYAHPYYWAPFVLVGNWE